MLVSINFKKMNKKLIEKLLKTRYMCKRYTSSEVLNFTKSLSSSEANDITKILSSSETNSFVKRQYSSEANDFAKSQSSSEDIFKCYSERGPDLSDKYRPLTAADYGKFISSRAAKRQPGLTRQITSLAYKVGKQMVSLAEGMPNEEVFPFHRLVLGLKAGGELTMEGQELAAALQYVPSQGLPDLLSSLREFQDLLHRPPPVPAGRDVMATNGAQHAIYQCCELLVEPGDPVIVSEYAYTGVHSALKPYDPEILGIPEDADGIIPDILEQTLEDRASRGLRMPRMMYVIPTGNNPTGSVLTEERKRRIYELACRYDFLIVEDEPYMFLNYTDTLIPSFLSLDCCGRVVRLDSLSKVVSAGLRAGWVTAPGPLRDRLELHMQAELLHSCTLAQAILLKLLSSRACLARHLLRARGLYRARRDALHEALRGAEAHKADVARWDEPGAGLFLWLRVHGVDDIYNMVFKTAFERGLMLIPGQAFQYDTSAPCSYVRLTFSKVPTDKIDVAARTLVEIIREEQIRTSRDKESFATQQ